MAVGTASEFREPVFEPGQTAFETGIFGNRPEMHLRLDSLVMVSQTRNSKNRIAAELEESIAKDLHNSILVARLSYEDFLNYVDFVNRLWRVDNNAEEVPVDEAGFVNLVIAGHTRVETIQNLAQKRIEQGLPPVEGGALVLSRIYEGQTPKDIIGIQLDENIYFAPPKERTAMAIVETYLWGLENGEWHNRAEFMRVNKNRFNYKLINDALSFTELPAEIRDFVLEGGIPYVAGVELGKTVAHHEAYDLVKYFGGRGAEQLSEEELAKLHDGTMAWLGYEVAHLQKTDDKGKKLFNSTAIIRGRYESLRNEYLAAMPAESVEDQPEQQSLETMVDPMEEYRLVRRKLRDEHAALVRRLASNPLNQAARLIALHGELLGWDEEAVSALPESISREFVQKIGRRSLAQEDSLATLHIA